MGSWQCYWLLTLLVGRFELHSSWCAYLPLHDEVATRVDLRGGGATPPTVTRRARGGGTPPQHECESTVDPGDVQGTRLDGRTRRER